MAKPNAIKVAIWARVDAELQSQNKTWDGFVKAFRLSKNASQNWKSYGLPRLHFLAIASYIGKTVDWVEFGIESSEEAYKVCMNNDVTIPFQSRVQSWVMECFGPAIASDTKERNHRFLEESLELVQACGCTQSEAHQLVDYVYGRDVGEKHQEVGGVLLTLAALCLSQHLDMQACGETELARVWTKVAQIRAKQAAKPKYSPLPQHVDGG